MSVSAIVMMVVFIVVIWGGMVAAMLKLRGHPDLGDDDPEPVREETT